jgi:hypothetical protein
MEENTNYDQFNMQDMPPLGAPTNFQKLRKVPIYKNKTVDLVALAIILFVIAGFFAFYTYLNTPTSTEKLSPLVDRAKSAVSKSDPLAPKEITNPITGIQYTKAEASDWLDDRPLGVMINNHIDARPQSGLIYADVVYEVVAEGGITRFLAFFLSDVPEKFGPIRSTREYYLVLVKELGDAMLMHEGYSPQALAAIDSWPVRSLQRGGASGLFNWRDNPRNVATEHTLYSNGKELKEYGNEQLGWAGKSDIRAWTFHDEVKPAFAPEGCFVGECKPITIDFWFSGDYSAIWDYDVATNSYLRSTGYDLNGEPIPHNDQDTGEQVIVKNLVVQFTTESPIVGDDKSRLQYDLVGSGEGLIFMDGGVTNATWSKDSRDGRTIFYDVDGREIEFNPGKFWISIVPERNKDQVVF